MTSAFYSHDANGNVSQLVSPDGDLLAQYEYSPFGETVVSTGSFAKANPFRFSTKWFDNDTGLGDWGYRWYSPEMGRWLSRDPIEDEGWVASFGDADAILSRLTEQYEFAGNLYEAFGNAVPNTVDVLGLLSPCAEFKQSPNYDDQRGGTICKDGKKHFCVWTPKGSNSGIDYCIGQHELAHDAHTKCQPCGLVWAEFNDPSKWQEGECVAWKAELGCLKKQKPATCNKLMGPAKKKCQKEFDEAIKENEDYLNENCP